MQGHFTNLRAEEDHGMIGQQKNQYFDDNWDSKWVRYEKRK